jgi:gamma-glutamylcyclotransferase (GGCT)/AIG2-like uncharacterized protein YtfP
MAETLYFAYGSNINLDQMAYRCPAAQVVGPVILENYELLFRGNAGGHGVATIAPRQGHEVHGLLWKLTPACEESLDHYEGYPHLYDKQPVTVRNRDGQQMSVMAYVMTGGNLWREAAMPSEYYYRGIQDGYQQNGLPVSKLKAALAHTSMEIFQKAKGRSETDFARSKPPKRRNGHER